RPSSSPQSWRRSRSSISSHRRSVPSGNRPGPRHTRTARSQGEVPVGEPIEIVQLRAQRTATIRRTVPRSGLGAFFAEVTPTLIATIAAQGATPAGPPYGRYYNGDPAAFDTEAGIPFSGAVNATGEIRVAELPAGRAAKTVHVGPYDSLPSE